MAEVGQMTAHTASLRIATRSKEPVSQVRKRYHQLADDLRARIESGDIAAGDKLPTERHMASQYAVSRTTVREALLALELAGLVDIRGGAGVFARGTVKHDVASESAAAQPTAFEIIDARRAFEPEVAAAAAAAARHGDFAAMEAAIAEMETEERSGSDEERADRLFHLAVAQATGNQVLANVVRTLWDQTEALAWQRTLQLVRTADRRGLWIADHRKVMAAIRAGDRNAARKAMKAHLNNVRQVMLTSELGRDSPGAKTR